MPCEISVKQQSELQKLRLADSTVGMLATDVVESLDGAKIKDVERVVWEMEALCRRVSVREAGAPAFLIQFLIECGAAGYLTASATEHFSRRVLLLQSTEEP